MFSEQEKKILATIPSFSAFDSSWQHGNLISTSLVIPFDHETPVALANRFVDEPHFFLLESATSGAGQMARYTFLGFEPLFTWSYEISGPGVGAATICDFSNIENPTIAVQERVKQGDPLASLKEILNSYKIAVAKPEKSRRSADIEEMGGIVGWLGYDLATIFEPSIGIPPPKQLGLPDGYYFLPQNLLVLDHLTRQLHLVRYCNKSSWKDSKAAYDFEYQSLGKLLQRVRAPQPMGEVQISDRPLEEKNFRDSITKEEFIAAAKRGLEEIKAGEIFQLQIGHRLQCTTSARAIDIFRHLRMLNPSPYMFYFKFGDHIILGASPEMMVGVQGRRIVHRPLAGTRKRIWQPERDLAMRKELMESSKERAEHIMLVDLSRNDIGRVASPGSVKVEELMAVEEYSHVFHLVSQVAGERQTKYDAFDVMRTSFPNGTVTGAPKIRAMQLIAAMEPCSREFYAGSLGLFDFSGNLKSTILIRSMHYKGGIVSTQASAGIVYDSLPDQEWLETRNKMAACLTAMQNTL